MASCRRFRRPTRARARAAIIARRNNPTIRQLAQHAGSYAGLAFVGTAATIAEGMETWLAEEACDTNSG